MDDARAEYQRMRERSREWLKKQARAEGVGDRLVATLDKDAVLDFVIAEVVAMRQAEGVSAFFSLPRVAT